MEALEKVTAFTFVDLRFIIERLKKKKKIWICTIKTFHTFKFH